MSTEFTMNSILNDDGTGPKLLEPGDYKGVITWIEEDCYNGGPKLPPCPRKMVTVACKTEDGMKELKTPLFVTEKMAWKLSEFFRAVGRKKHGEPYRMDWTGLVGLKLKVHVNVRKYTGSDGEEHFSNNIDRFYDYDPADFEDEDRLEAGWVQEGENPFAQDDIPF